jgi:hypothetical protein
MGGSRLRDASSGRFERAGVPGSADRRWSPPFVIRYAGRHLGFLAGLVIAAVVMGVVYFRNAGWSMSCRGSSRFRFPCLWRPVQSSSFGG